jgi:hypothetical protein
MVVARSVHLGLSSTAGGQARRDELGGAPDLRSREAQSALGGVMPTLCT